MILELKNIIEANKIEFQKKLEDKMQEFENKIEEKENSLKNKIEENKTEIQNKMEEKDNLYNNKIKEIQEEREKIENEIITSVSKHQEEIQGLQLTEKYVKDKLILDEKENEKEIEKHIYKRVLDNFNMEIYMILYEKKIKFNIKEIQDDLKSNLLIYETNFTIEKLSEKTVHFKNLGNIESIFKFLHDLLNDKKDKIKKKKNKIIISVKFPLGNNFEEISFDILFKDISLETSLKNINESLKEINKNNIITNNEISKMKEEFKKDLLEKVYPIGSYYWSDKNISPGDIFGGSWTQIRGKFLFASDSNHNVGETGGEEKHRLTIDEIPSHNHEYQKFDYLSCGVQSSASGADFYYPIKEYKRNDSKFLKTNWTQSVGGGNLHNNMPPYLTTNCWKRIG